MDLTSQNHHKLVIEKLQWILLVNTTINIFLIHNQSARLQILFFQLALNQFIPIMNYMGVSLLHVDEWIQASTKDTNFQAFSPSMYNSFKLGKFNWPISLIPISHYFHPNGMIPLSSYVDEDDDSNALYVVQTALQLDNV